MGEVKMRHPDAVRALSGAAYLPGMAPQPYYRRWEVWLRGERLGEVLAAIERAACLRAVHKFEVKDEDRRDLVVRRVKG
jgi:hypothetical protein